MRHKKAKPGQELRLAKKVPLSSSEFSFLSTASLCSVPNFHLYRSRWSNRRLGSGMRRSRLPVMNSRGSVASGLSQDGPILPRFGGHSPGEGSHLNVISITTLCRGRKRYAHREWHEISFHLAFRFSKEAKSRPFFLESSSRAPCD